MAVKKSSCTGFDLVHFSLICLIVSFAALPGTYSGAGRKCVKTQNTSAEVDLFRANDDFPQIRLDKIIPLGIARNLLENEKPPGSTSLVKWSRDGALVVPSTLETIQFECSAKYRVQWGFESYPWITWDTWTVVNRPEDENGTEIYSAVVEFHKVQETSLQTRIPICYSVQNPCIQTALVPHSGPGNAVEIKIVNGSSYEIQSKSEKEQFGANGNCSLNFGYDPATEKFYCQETKEDKKNSGKIFLRPCPDPVTCESLVASSNCSFKLEDFVPSRDCTIQNRCRMETAISGKFAGIAVCHSGNAAEHSAAIPYFFSLTKDPATNRPRRYLQWTDANPSDMIELQLFENQIFTKEKFSIKCNASYFYLGSGMYFTLIREDSSGPDSVRDDEAKNGNENAVKEDYDELSEDETELEGAKESVIYDDANIGGIGSKLPLVRRLEVNNFAFEAPGTYKISCYAPVWNTTDWGKASKVINVKKSILPVFDGGNSTVKEYYAPNKKLQCMAYGIPKPELNWTRDGSPIPSEIILTTGEQNHTLVWAYLTFPSSEYGIHGNFTCAASNVQGTVKKSFIIIPAAKNSSAAIWVLVGLALLISVLIPLILFLTWKVRRQKRYIDELTPEEIDEFINGKPDYVPFHCDMSTYAYYLPFNKDYEIARDSLEIGRADGRDLTRILGSGEYGMVIYGIYKNANPPDGGPPIVKPVAVKTTKPLTSGKEYFKALLSELKIMSYIGSHDNIVNLIGACIQNIKRREVYIATEYCEHGSLLSYLRMNRHVYENPLAYAELAHSRSVSSSMSEETSFISPIPSVKGEYGTKGNADVQYVKMEDLGNVVINQGYENLRNLKLQDLIQWSYDIACGMEFLSEKKVIHGDLAARNVLLSRDCIAKIGDFGLSRQLYHYTSYTKTAVTPLPLKWLAIECLQNFQFSCESDVWAYGVTLFEIFSIGEIPYSSVQMNGEEFLRALMQGMRLSKPTYAPIDIFDLMMKCWKHERKQRPKFTDIVKFLQPKVNRIPRDKIPRSLSTDSYPRSTLNSSFASVTHNDTGSECNSVSDTTNNEVTVVKDGHA